jgi:PAS domain-containing protein
MSTTVEAEASVGDRLVTYPFHTTGIIMRFNDAAAEMLGYEKEDAIAGHVSMILPVDRDRWTGGVDTLTATVMDLHKKLDDSSDLHPSIGKLMELAKNAQNELQVR